APGPGGRRARGAVAEGRIESDAGTVSAGRGSRLQAHAERDRGGAPGRPRLPDDGDRKSTRLNSSHVETSYAVFCLKKKKLLELSRPKPEAIWLLLPMWRATCTKCPAGNLVPRSMAATAVTPYY